MKKPKILFVVPLPPPYHGATIQSQMRINSKRLNQKYEIRVIPLRFVKEIKDIGKFSFIKIFKMIILSLKLIRFLICFKPELVNYSITHEGYSFYRDYLLISIIKLFRTKIIYHHHTKGASEAKKIKRLLQKWIYKGAFSIVLSPLLIYDIKHLVPEKRIFIVPNGIPDIKVKAKKKGNSVPLILFLSNLIMEKGVFVLLNAFSILRKKGYLFKGVFAGSWSYNIDKDIFFKKIKKLNLEKHIQIKGTIYGEKKISLLNGSDIFVFPTFMKHETFGNVLLEAMRSSLPVVASDEGSIPFIIKNGTTGYITKKEDPHDLADKLAHLLKDENLRNKMGKRGRERYLTHFTFDHFEKNYDHVLHKILYYREKK